MSPDSQVHVQLQNPIFPPKLQRGFMNNPGTKSMYVIMKHVYAPYPVCQLRLSGRVSDLKNEHQQAIPVHLSESPRPSTAFFQTPPNNLPPPLPLRRTMKPSAFVMQIKSFLKEPHLRKQCQAFGTKRFHQKQQDSRQFYHRAPLYTLCKTFFAALLYNTVKKYY